MVFFPFLTGPDSRGHYRYHTLSSSCIPLKLLDSWRCAKHASGQSFLSHPSSHRLQCGHDLFFLPLCLQDCSAGRTVVHNGVT